MPPQQTITDPKEAPLATKVFRSFGGCYTKAQRSALPENRFYDLQNVMPIGDANLHTVFGLSASLHDFGAHTIYAAIPVQVASVSYLMCFASDGTVWAYNIVAGTAAEISGSYTLSASGAKCVSFYNTYVLFVDTTGYYSWNGSGNMTLLSLSGGPTGGSDITVYSGCVFVSSGKLIQISAAYNGTSDTDPTMVNAWSETYGATFLYMADPTLVGNIVRLWEQNGFLYIVGVSCLYALSNLYVPSGASPPVPVFTLTPIQSIIGTDQAFSLFAFNTALMLCNRFGIYGIEGVTAQRLSEDIDGTFQYLTFSQSVSGGACVVENVLNAAFLLTRSNDPVLGSGNIVAMWFDSRWWFANIGSATFIVSAIVNGVPTLLAFIGNKLYQCFDTSQVNPPATQVMTPLWSMDDPLSDKEVVRAGIEITTSAYGPTSTVTTTIDGIQNSQPFPAVDSLGNIVFINNSSAVITFIGAGSVAINWIVGTWQLYQGNPPGMWSKYVGMTFQTTGIAYELDSFMMDFKLRKRW